MRIVKSCSTSFCQNYSIGSSQSRSWVAWMDHPKWSPGLRHCLKALLHTSNGVLKAVACPEKCNVSPLQLVTSAMMYNQPKSFATAEVCQCGSLFGCHSSVTQTYSCFCTAVKYQYQSSRLVCKDSLQLYCNPDMHLAVSGWLGHCF